MGDEDSWRELLRREFEVGHQAADHAAAVTTIADHQVVAITVMLRMLKHVQGAQLLLAQPEMVVEARTLVRNCFECFFHLAAIVERGPAIVAEMTRDEIASRNKRAEFMVRRKIGDDEMRDRLRKLLRENGKTTNRGWTTPKERVAGGPVEDAHLFYAQLSADSAHISLDALDRHLKIGAGDDVEFDADPLPREGEIVETMQFLSTALCGSIVALNQALGFPMPSTVIGEIWDAHISLSNATTS